MTWLRRRWARSAALAVMGIAFLAGLLVVGTGRPWRARKAAEACQENLKVLAAACEMYAQHNSGRYPCSDLPLETPQGLRSEVLRERLVPAYLRAVPLCPAAGTDTYTATYLEDDPHHYVVRCEGTHHEGAGAPAGFPRYDSDRGLRARPDGDEPVDTVNAPGAERLEVDVGDLAPGLGEAEARKRGARGAGRVLAWSGGRVFLDGQGRVYGVSAQTLRQGQGRLHASWPRVQVEDELGPPARTTWMRGAMVAQYDAVRGHLDVIYDRSTKPRVRTFVISR